jgi:hypothetical protein
MAILSILSGYDVPALIEGVKDKASKAKDFDEANYVWKSAMASMKNLAGNEIPALRSLFLVCGFVYSLHLQSGAPGQDKEEIKQGKREIKNKWIRFEHNFNNTYKKFHAYFKRYGII